MCVHVYLYLGLNQYLKVYQGMPVFTIHTPSCTAYAFSYRFNHYHCSDIVQSYIKEILTSSNISRYIDSTPWGRYLGKEKRLSDYTQKTSMKFIHMWTCVFDHCENFVYVTQVKFFFRSERVHTEVNINNFIQWH